MALVIYYRMRLAHLNLVLYYCLDMHSLDIYYIDIYLVVGRVEFCLLWKSKHKDAAFHVTFWKILYNKSGDIISINLSIV